MVCDMAVCDGRGGPVPLRRRRSLSKRPPSLIDVGDERVDVGVLGNDDRYERDDDESGDVDRRVFNVGLCHLLPNGVIGLKISSCG